MGIGEEEEFRSNLWGRKGKLGQLYGDSWNIEVEKRKKDLYN